MRTRGMFAVLFISAFAAAPALASFGGSSKPDSPGQPSTDVQQVPVSTARQEAERWYGDAYDEVARARKDLAEDKKKNADKKFKKALDRGERAVELDSTYYEAWNLVGFCARNLTLYDRSLAAYARCLKIKPDYAPAREYLGEAYVELGQPDKAREQLAWLSRLNATEQVTSLKARLDAWVQAHPDSTAATPARAAADSSSAATTSSKP